MVSCNHFTILQMTGPILLILYCGCFGLVAQETFIHSVDSGVFRRMYPHPYVAPSNSSQEVNAPQYIPPQQAASTQQCAMLQQKYATLQQQYTTLQEQHTALQQQAALRQHATLQKQHAALQQQHDALQQHASLQHQHVVLQQQHAALQHVALQYQQQAGLQKQYHAAPDFQHGQPQQAYNQHKLPLSLTSTPLPPIEARLITEPDSRPVRQQDFDPNHVEVLPELKNPKNPKCERDYDAPRFCQERSTCFYTYSLYQIVDQYSTCTLPSGDTGVCCPSDDFPWVVQPYARYNYYEGIIIRDTRDLKIYENAFIKAKTDVMKLETQLGNIEENFTSKYENSQQDIIRTPHAVAMAVHNALILSSASKILKQSEGPDLRFVSLRNTQLESTCRETPTCDLSPYRNIDGTCNNLIYPLWGSTKSAFQRMIKPNYGDGIETPRLAKSGQNLPSGRFINVNYVTDDVNKSPPPSINKMAMSFAQLIADDLSRVAVFTGPRGKTISCCTPYALANPIPRACYPIILQSDDPSYSDGPCIEFVRALPAQSDDCKLSNSRDPMNQVTHALDCSFLYGSDKETLDKIRLNEHGLLRTTTIYGEEMLPNSGDSRANQQPEVVTLDVITHREHNRLARELIRINPHWNDEKLFQEARKILIAQIQHITFNEYLPLLVDYYTRMDFGILLKSNGYSENYDPRLKPNVVCAFEAAAFRIGHSPVQNHHISHNKNSKLDDLLNGLLLEPSQCPDGHLSKALTLDIIKGGRRLGLDLYTMNIQRGRDIGLNGYNEMRTKCSLPRAAKFSDFTDVMEQQHVQTLEEIYDHVDDVDLYTASVLETPIQGLLVGHTFRCIIAHQFQKIRLGDRFWYERYSADENVGFTEGQLAEIRRSTLAGMLCLNSKIELIQPLALILNFRTNSRVNCSRIPKFNLFSWKEAIVKEEEPKEEV